MNLDDTDKKILNALQKDCRQSAYELAKKLKIPKSTIQRRISKYEKEQLIDAATLILNPKKAGFSSTAIVMIKISQFKLKNGQLPLRYIADNLSNFEEIQEVHSLAGEFDIMCKVRGKDPDTLNEWIFKKLPNVEGIDRITTYSVFYTAKETQKLNL